MRDLTRFAIVLALSLHFINISRELLGFETGTLFGTIYSVAAIPAFFGLTSGILNYAFTTTIFNITVDSKEEAESVIEKIEKELDQ